MAILLAEISSLDGMSCSIWLILLLLKEPLDVYNVTDVLLCMHGYMQGTTLEDFQHQLSAKTTDLFPSLTEEDLKPYLLRSRATNAYDAVTLLAKSVDVAFKQGGDNCTNTSIIQVSLDKVFMVRD